MNQNTSSKKPDVGIATIIIKDNKVLLGRRIGTLATGTWGFAGGRLELGETPEECAVRETLEETGQKIYELKRIGFTNALFDGFHWITLYISARSDDEPQIMEPDKCAEWIWFNWNNLPSPLMQPIHELLKQGITPFNNQEL